MQKWKFVGYFLSCSAGTAEFQQLFSIQDTKRNSKKEKNTQDFRKGEISTKKGRRTDFAQKNS